MIFRRPTEPALDSERDLLRAALRRQANAPKRLAFYAALYFIVAFSFTMAGVMGALAATYPSSTHPVLLIQKLAAIATFSSSFAFWVGACAWGLTRMIHLIVDSEQPASDAAGHLRLLDEEERFAREMSVFILAGARARSSVINAPPAANGPETI